MPLEAASVPPFTYSLHGVQVADPFQWLEDRNSVQTESWIQAQRRRCEQYFAETPGLRFLRTRVKTYLDRESFDQPARVGSRLFYRRRRVNQEQGAICVREADTERVLFDPSRHGPFCSVAIQAISNDGCLLAIAMRRDGSDRTELLTISVDTATVQQESIPLGYGRGFAFANDGTGLFYCRETPHDASAHTIYFHPFDGRISEDRPVLQLSGTAEDALFLIGDAQRIGAIKLRQSGGNVQRLRSRSRAAQSGWSETRAARRGLRSP